VPGDHEAAQYRQEQSSFKMRLPDAQTRKLLDRYVRAWESADIDGIVSLLSDDALFPMPPFPVRLQGKPVIQDFISKTILAGNAQNRWKLIQIRANGQPGFAFYQVDELARTYHAFALQVLTIENGLVCEASTFGFPALFRFFNLPPLLAT
jgi:RNA polymerase sigma-70 factor (ECF subfamily)